jgi:CheY-like chemotaxis protein
MPDDAPPASILVVEDDPDFRQTLVELLAGAGYRATGVENGKEALELMRNSTPSLVLLDLAMPHMDGWEFRLEQKRDPNLSSTPVFVITAVDTDQSEDIDADLVLQKPFDFKKLLESIKSRLSKRELQHVAHAERMLSLGELTVGIAHEVTNCLAYINGNLEHLEEQWQNVIPEAERERFLQVLADARAGGARIAALVRDVSLYASIEREGRHPTDAQAALDQAIRLSSHEIRHRARLVRLYEEIPLVNANDRLVDAFSQLLLSAAHAINPGNAEANEIAVSTRLEPDSRACIRITCTGSDVRYGDLERAFDPLWSKGAPGEVMGIGPTLCQRIITAFGGELWLSTIPDRSSTLTVCLPVAQGRTERAVQPRRARVLIVDDEAAICRSLQRLLSDDYDVTECKSGAEALELLERDSNYDVILCDLMMPNVTAMQLYQRLAARRPELAPRIVFMTACEFAEPMRSFLESVPNKRVSKPVSIAALRELIAKAVGSESTSVLPR